MSREYHRETDLFDLDLTGFTEITSDAIIKYFYQIRSFIHRISDFEHDYNFCLLNKKGFDFQEDFVPILRKYEVFTKHNFTAGFLVMQENGKIRYLTAHGSNHYYLDNAFSINSSKDVSEYKELIKRVN